MAILVAILCAVGGILLGGLIGFFARHLILAKQKRQAEAQATALLTEAEGKQKALLLEAREEVHQIRRSAENEYKERRNEVRRQEKRLTQKEETLDRKVESVDRRLQNLSDKEEALDRKGSRSRRTEGAPAPEAGDHLQPHRRGGPRQGHR